VGNTNDPELKNSSTVAITMNFKVESGSTMQSSGFET